MSSFTTYSGAEVKVKDFARAMQLNRNTVALLYNETAARLGLNLLKKLHSFF